MKKRLLGLVCSLLLCMTMTMSVFAWSDMPLLVDDADLLTDTEEEIVLEELEEVSAAHGLDVVVVTINDLLGQDIQAYADDFYDYNGYAEDGILLLIDMGSSEWYISTTGYGITAFTDAGIEYISEQFVWMLSDEMYMDAFTTFADYCDDFINQAKTGQPYDIDNLPKEAFSFVGTLFISLVIGFVVALIITGIMRAKLKSVHFQSEAADYVKAGSFKLTQSRDLYLYRNVVRREKPQNTSGGSTTHTSSSGRSHGGGGGKF